MLINNFLETIKCPLPPQRHTLALWRDCGAFVVLERIFIGLTLFSFFSNSKLTYRVCLPLWDLEGAERRDFVHLK